MPLLTELGTFQAADFYRNVTPTAFGRRKRDVEANRHFPAPSVRHLCRKPTKKTYKLRQE
jgi:hypothetical protein